MNAKKKTISMHGVIVGVGLFAVCLTAHAASKTDLDTNKTAKPVSALPAPRPAPVPERPTFVPERPEPAPPRPTFPDRPVVDNRLPATGERPAPRATFPVKTPPVTTLPSPATLPAWKREPAEQSFVETALVSFARGETRSVSLFFSADGHRLQIDSYTVVWRLPRGQTGVIDFAPSPNNSHLPAGSLGIYADPGEPLKIYGSRTGGDGSGMATITFFGTKTPVPREQKDPTDF